MDFEFFIVLILIVVFLISCCGLIKKIKENYETSPTGQSIPVSHSQMHIHNRMYTNNAYQRTSDDLHHGGVFPACIAPPPYAEYLEPPPRYEEVIKNNHTVIPVEQQSIATTHNYLGVYAPPLEMETTTSPGTTTQSVQERSTSHSVPHY